MTLASKVKGLLIGLVVVLLIALALIFCLRVQRMHSYLKQTAGDLRRVLSDMDCRIWMQGEYPAVQHPDRTQTRPTPCPPGGGTVVPKDPPW